MVSPSHFDVTFFNFRTLSTFCSRYENHSPSTTQGNGTSSTSERDERNGTDKAAELNIKNEVNFLSSLKKCNANLINLSFPLQTGAEDLRMKMEMRQSLQSPLASSAPPTPTITPVVPYASTKGIPVGLEGTIAPADMLNVLSAHRESVNTADGKDLTKHLHTLKHTLSDTWRFDSHAVAVHAFVWLIDIELQVDEQPFFLFLFCFSVIIYWQTFFTNISHFHRPPIFRQETSMSALWSTIRLRDKLKGPHSSAPSGNSSTMSILFENVHAQQYGASTYSARAQASANRYAVSKLSCFLKLTSDREPFASASSFAKAHQTYFDYKWNETISLMNVPRKRFSQKWIAKMQQWKWKRKVFHAPRESEK